MLAILLFNKAAAYIIRSKGTEGFSLKAVKEPTAGARVMVFSGRGVGS